MLVLYVYKLLTHRINENFQRSQQELTQVLINPTNQYLTINMRNCLQNLGSVPEYNTSFYYRRE